VLPLALLSEAEVDGPLSTGGTGSVKQAPRSLPAPAPPEPVPVPELALGVVGGVGGRSSWAVRIRYMYAECR
jgi:hypothetical protein